MSRRRTTSSLKQEQRGPRKRWLAVLLAVTLLIAAVKITTLVTGRTNPVDQALITTTSPVVYVLKRMGEGLASLRYLFMIPALLNDKNRLETENALLARKLSETAQLAQENERLRKLAGLPPTPGFKLVNATVLERPYDLWLESALISAGSREGVTVGNLVGNEYGIVGIVEEVQPGYSRVELISSPRFKLGVVSSDSRDEGVLRGVKPGEMELDFIPAGSKIAFGEKLFTRGETAASGSGANRPRGIFCGMVTTRVAEGGYLRITVEPGASTNRLGAVVVYTK
jgi:rod shape-determining protein MreC